MKAKNSKKNKKLDKKITNFWLLCACAGGLVCTGPAFAADGVGQVLSIKPGAYVLRSGAQLPLELKSRVMQSDVLLTDANGKLQVLLDDDSTIALAPDTRLDLQTVTLEGKPEFKAHVSTGLARFITGKIVESNPAGFAVSTPEGTVGIRGTMFAVRSGGGNTTLYVFNAGRPVTMNNIHVGTGQKITIGPGITNFQPVPMTPAEVDALDRLTASGIASGNVAGNASGQDTTLGGRDLRAGAIPTEKSGIAGLAVNQMTSPLGFIATHNVPPVPPVPPAPNWPTSGSASVSGILSNVMNFNSIDYTQGSFGFNVNLSNGRVSNASMSIQKYPLPSGPSTSISSTNGIGSINATSLNVGGFTNTGYYGSTPEHLTGTPSVSGGQLVVTGNYGVGDCGVLVQGTFSGSGTITP